MKIEDLLFWVVVAGVVYWYSRRRKAELLSKDFPLAPPPSQKTKECSDDISSDRFLEQISLKKTSVQSDVARGVKKLHDELHERYAADIELKQTLSKVAQENGLDKALAAVWEEIQYYPTWSKRSDFDLRNALGISGDITEEKSTDTETVCFTFGGHQFKITKKDWCGEGETYSNISLDEDGYEVFAINCGINVGNEVSRYFPLSVEAFRKGGTWAMVLLEFSAKLELKNAKAIAEAKYYGAAAVKSKFSS